MYQKARSGHRGVDVKLLADIGYIADRLRSLEQRWELAELKDLHKRIVLSIEDPPVNVVCAKRDGQLRPVQSELHGNSQLQQEVEQAAQAAQEVEAAKRNQRLQSAHQEAQGQPDPCNGDDEAQAKLVQLEDFLIALHRSYAEVRRASQKCKKKLKTREPGASDKGNPNLPLSSSQTFTSPSESSEASSPLRISSEPKQTQTQKQPHPQKPLKLEQEQSFTTSQADRTMNQDRELEDPNVASEQQTKLPLVEEATSNPSQQVNTNNQSDAKQEPQAASAGDNNSQQNSTSSTNSCSTTPQRFAIAEQSTKEEDEDDTTAATTTSIVSTVSTVVNAESGSFEQQKRPSLETFSSSPPSSRTAPRGCGPSANGNSTEPDEEEEDTDDEDVHDAERNKLRKRISELTNNFASAKQYQQMCDNIDKIHDVELRALIRELKRKIEFAERMNWLCLSSRPRGPPHRKTSLPKHTDVKKRFLEIADKTLSDDVKAALRLPAFDSYEWEDWDVIHLMQTMFVELNLVEKFQIPRETLSEWLYEVYKHYNDVPFHNYRHCFCVAQMMYAITWHTNLVKRLGELEVLVLLVSCICHDLDHPGYNNIYQINARTELALRYNDISPLENHHCSIAFRLLEHPDCNIFRNMDKELYKDVREGIIRCILATDMARHNEILTQFQEATPVFDYNNKVHTNLLCMVLIKVADISNEARPLDVAEPWLDRLLQEFFAQSAAEKSEGLPVTPFMDPDKVSKPGSQVRFIGLVLLPLFEALGELLPELTDLIITPVRVALDYYKKLNDAANRTRRSIAEAEQSSENSTGTAGTGTGTAGTEKSSLGGGAGTGSSGSPQLPRSQSGISVKSRRTELHDLPEGSESGDSETATEVDVAEKTSKFKVDTESSNRKQSHPSSRKGSREKRPSMIGEYYTTGTRIRGSHGNIQHTNRTYFGSNRAISLDQYSNSRRMSDGIQIQTVVSDNSVYYHQRQHRSLEHDSTGMYSSSDKSTSLNSSNDQSTQQQPQQQHQQQHQQPIGPPSFQSSHHAHLHHHHYQQAAAALHQMRAVQDCENMNISVPPAATSGKIYATFNNNSSNNNKNIGKKMNWSQQQKLESLRNGSNNNNNGNSSVKGSGREGMSGTAGNGKSGGCNGTSGTTSKSIISRLRQLTGRLSFSFDPKESKKLQVIATSGGEGSNESESDGSGKGSCTQRKTRLLEKSKTVDVGGTVAICGDSVEGAGDFCGAGGMILNQPKSISPILMQHRNSDVINTINSARNRAYSLDVPLSRNCCRSLSGSTAGGGGSSCGGSQKSITFSLNKSLNEEVNDTTISSGGGGGTGGGIRLPSLDDAIRNGGSVGETI
ncbi:high affinity cGMP-specific 3',5'-cyclic phosphodiesterase 9A isoform X2 [Toxorhynchites rutilus septentrionalis]|uniref:high affinity cGMP-specific 3',5'-cyclic phosphodiesterase 9A isoform X2 n=1 Tax=Toxorhynchites rutilus septentrionalis TaxID=329112 RepID=UPI0024798A1B|nr:high affinity cGMP-specific 3',5'-cyclic phosphodiesterase 9A isoform X2 [Toxorhynchites rutilus septentrionalis]